MKKSLILLAAAALAFCAAAAQAAGVLPHGPELVTHFAGRTMHFDSSLLGAAGLGFGGITTFWQKGDVLDLAPGADVSSGQGYLFGAALFGVAAMDVKNGVVGPFVVEGVVTIAKTSALAISVGDRLYWDSTNKCVNKTATSQQHVGIAVEVAANPSATVKMLLETNVALAA